MKPSEQFKIKMYELQEKQEAKVTEAQKLEILLDLMDKLDNSIPSPCRHSYVNTGLFF